MVLWIFEERANHCSSDSFLLKNHQVFLSFLPKHASSSFILTSILQIQFKYLNKSVVLKVEQMPRVSWPVYGQGHNSLPQCSFLFLLQTQNPSFIQVNGVFNQKTIFPRLQLSVVTGASFKQWDEMQAIQLCRTSGKSLLKRASMPFFFLLHFHTWHGAEVAMATDTILDNEVTVGMEATSRGWWSRKIGMQVPDDSMEVPSQPPTAVYVRENHRPNTTLCATAVCSRACP